jgi:hypothetical protein
MERTIEKARRIAQAVYDLAHAGGDPEDLALAIESELLSPASPPTERDREIAAEMTGQDEIDHDAKIVALSQGAEERVHAEALESEAKPANDYSDWERDDLIAELERRDKSASAEQGEELIEAIWELSAHCGIYSPTWKDEMRKLLAPHSQPDAAATDRDRLRAWIQYISDIAYDRDGEKTADMLGALVDELRSFAQRALRGERLDPPDRTPRAPDASKNKQALAIEIGRMAAKQMHLGDGGVFRMTAFVHEVVARLADIQPEAAQDVRELETFFRSNRCEINANGTYVMNWTHTSEECFTEIERTFQARLASVKHEAKEVPMSSFANILAAPSVIRAVLAVVGYQIKE